MSRSPKNNGNRNAAEQIQVTAEGQFLVSGDLDFHTVPGILTASQSLIAGSQSITIDLSGVESSNSAGLALLVEWMRFADSKNCSITFQNLPNQMKQIAQLCGVDKKLPV